MDLFTKDDLKTMIRKPDGIGVSIYLPTHPMGRAAQQDPIRLKNLLEDAEVQLRAANLRRPEVVAILEPARKLLIDSHFWRHQSDGLALFFSKGNFQVFRLPLNFDELVIVADRFHIKPLLSLFQSDGQFHILALSQNQIRLLLGTRFSVDEVDLEAIPTSLAEALRFDDPERQLQFQTGTRASLGRGDRPAIFFGHGVGTDNAKTNILRYFHKVNKGLEEFFQESQAPLVLAGVDYLLPIYREANTYSHLIQESLEGNPDAMRPEALHAQAWRLVQPYLLAKQNQALDQFNHLMGVGSDLASTDLTSLTLAAYDGRVDTLFVALGTQIWGIFDPEDRTVNCYEEPKPNKEDLLDLAAAFTILNSGQVYVLPTDQMPGEAPLAGIFRYSYPQA